MADEDIVHEAIERLEWGERKEEESPSKKFRQMTRRTALTGAAAGIAAAALEACGSSSTGTTPAAASSGAGPFGSSGGHKFVMVNHVTTNSFFTATQYGCQDACALTGSSFQWTGSNNSIVGQMVSAFNSAIAAKASGIGCCLIDNTAFNSPVNTALSSGIPVIAYNADVSPGTKNARMAYVGQNNLTAGAAVGAEILKHVTKGDKVAGIIATPGTGNIQPRIDGLRAVDSRLDVPRPRSRDDPCDLVALRHVLEDLLPDRGARGEVVLPDIGHPVVLGTRRHVGVVRDHGNARAQRSVDG